ncbi:MAG TPA: hypothetical protein VHL58_01105 [Thermoanaerobaculia bacterium]|nr:hypothetical protein [Thermoanaerobaculia bacterium]
MEASQGNRRHTDRVRLPMPRPARLGMFNVVLNDVSIAGACIQHHVQVPPQTIFPLQFRWEKQQMELGCRVVRSRLETFNRGDTTLRIYQSGLLFVEKDGGLLKRAIEDRITRALDRQKADAYPELGRRPMPADSSGSLNLNMLFPMIAAVRSGFIRCTIEKGQWRREWVDTPEQPRNGFTISADERSEEIELLMKTYLNAGTEERRLIAIFAHLSVVEPSDVPRNSFLP